MDCAAIHASPVVRSTFPFGSFSFLILAGYYGVGKTNLALSLACAPELVGACPPVTLIDLDIVNPYFRSSDYRELLAARGVRVLAPTFAGSTLESPSLPAAIGGALEEAASGNDNTGTVIIDAGGDDAGATALGRYRQIIEPRANADGYGFWYVVNRYRCEDAADVAENLRAVEAACGLRVTALVNNSHLQDSTDHAVLRQGLDFAQRCAGLVRLPLLFTAVPRALLASCQQDAAFAGERLLGVERLVTTPWQEEA